MERRHLSLETLARRSKSSVLCTPDACAAAASVPNRASSPPSRVPAASFSRCKKSDVGSVVWWFASISNDIFVGWSRCVVETWSGCYVGVCPSWPRHCLGARLTRSFASAGQTRALLSLPSPVPLRLRGTRTRTTYIHTRIRRCSAERPNVVAA